MNKAFLKGRITSAVELKRTTTGKDVCSFTVAAKDRDNYPAYIDCVAWEATAVDISKYFAKDSHILVIGRLSNNNYETKDGNKVRKDECVVEQWEFAGAKNDENNGAEATPNPFVGNPPQAEKKSDLAPEEQPVFDELPEDDLPF